MSDCEPEKELISNMDNVISLGNVSTSNVKKLNLFNLHAI